VKIGTYLSVKKQQDELADLAAKAMVLDLKLMRLNQRLKLKFSGLLTK
jgi:hypothetical protein